MPQSVNLKSINSVTLLRLYISITRDYSSCVDIYPLRIFGLKLVPE